MNDSHQTPEQRARSRIDRLLRDAGWLVQDMADFNRNAAEGVAVREFQLPSGPCDYLLFIDRKAASKTFTACTFSWGLIKHADASSAISSVEIHCRSCPKTAWRSCN